MRLTGASNSMTAQTPNSKIVTEILPEKKQMPLEGLYLGQGLAGMSVQKGRTLVLTTYLTDRNEVIAKADQDNHFHVPPETRNASDWRLSQELMAQADVLISGGDYLKSVSTPGSHPQDILFQFEKGGEFEELGAWRLRTGFAKRSPDLAIVTRHLDFEIPEQLLGGSRRIVIFTTDRMAHSDGAKALTASGAAVFGSGETGVDGKEMIDYLGEKLSAHVIVMATGPTVLQLLLRAERLDFLYITQVQREIAFDDPSTVKTLLPDGKGIRDLKAFQLTHQYVQDHAVAGDGSSISQFFLRYDRI